MRRLTTTIAAVAMFAVVPGLAQAMDLRSPDARDSANIVNGHAPTGIMNGRYNGSDFGAAEQNLSSPDARDAARNPVETYTPGAAEQNLSSPDARDAARNPVDTYTPGRVIQPVQPTVHVDGSFDWGDAGIGAAGMLGVLAIVSGMFLLTMQRRRHRRLPFATS